MPTTRDFFLGPWRAVLVLGVTQILAWGAIFYPPVLTLPLIAAELGWSTTFVMGGFSLALLMAGLVSPLMGRLIDRHGGHRIMPVGSLLAALGLVALAHVEYRISYLAIWSLLGIAISASLYDPAFASLGRIFGAAARRPITALTLAGGFASTVSWPAAHRARHGGAATRRRAAVRPQTQAAPHRPDRCPANLRARSAHALPASSLSRQRMC